MKNKQHDTSHIQNRTYKRDFCVFLILLGLCAIMLSYAPIIYEVIHDKQNFILEEK